MPSANAVDKIRKILAACLVIFVAILAIGIVMKMAYTTKMSALASCTGTGCLTYGEQSLGFIRYFPPFLHVGAWGCGLSLIGLAVLKIKGQTIKDFDIRKSIKISGIVLATSLIATGVGFTLGFTYLNSTSALHTCRVFENEKCKNLTQHKFLGKLAPPMVQLGTVGVGVSVVYIACSSYTYKQIARSRSDQKDEPHP